MCYARHDGGPPAHSRQACQLRRFPPAVRQGRFKVMLLAPFLALAILLVESAIGDMLAGYTTCFSYKLGGDQQHA